MNSVVAIYQRATLKNCLNTADLLGEIVILSSPAYVVTLESWLQHDIISDTITHDGIIWNAVLLKTSCMIAVT